MRPAVVVCLTVLVATACAPQARRSGGGGGGGGGRPPAEGEGEGAAEGEGEGSAEGEGEGEGPAEGEGEGPAEGEGEGPPCEPAPEICDGEDNDCDRQVDEDDPELGEGCSTGLPGPCWQGRKRCEEGELVCRGVVQPQDELCDGLDNDCDGEEDEGRPQADEACRVGDAVGECINGISDCVNGILICNELPPGVELCDGLDNDCDEEIDEGAPGHGEPCDTGEEGVCGDGIGRCDNGVFDCVQQQQPSPEVCDGRDNDCDGELDEDDGAGGECPEMEPLTFEYTGAPQVWRVSFSGRFHVELWGAAGATGLGTSPDRNGAPGQGGHVWGVLELQRNEELVINVGGQGASEAGGGFNGGGASGRYGGSGGGATDVRRGGDGLEHRVLVAGGGGGGNGGSPRHGTGGNGGGLEGEDGVALANWVPGGGGTQEQGGSAGSQAAAGQAGNGAGSNEYHHAGGGGGWFGGGGAYAAGAGGGSSYFGGGEEGSGGTDVGGRDGNGRAVISIAH